MNKPFGIRSDGREAHLYTITGGGLTAQLSDHGATLVRLFVPDRQGRLSDVVLGFDHPDDYTASGTFFGATVGRNANRIGGAVFPLKGKAYALDTNDNGKNNLHSGFDPYKNRLWQVVSQEENAITFGLHSPHLDQGFPGNASIRITYRLEADASLRICYDGICDRDTVFNLTNHSYYNLAGHEKPEKAMDQLLCLPARHFVPADAESIPTGELREVAGTPMDFRLPKAIGQDIGEDYDALRNQNGYDHTFEVFTQPCAILSDPHSGRSMAVYTDCPGVQLYTGNFLMGESGKDNASYCRRGGVCLETQHYPDSVNNPQWKQPFVKANTPWRSQTRYKFSIT